MVEGKLLKSEESKGADDSAIRDACSSPGMIQEAIRLPNISLKTAAEHILRNQGPERKGEGFSSPTRILQQIGQP